ncbi:lysophospholipid acyltransferase family protein [Sphingomonas solaris]|uniref:1-acyl-sn-glycerol-3-phosphate acyltransferase n=1 Tax=Alterirhizorhabdus solaris TaxID=2529389 RepID=A0A558QR98_9SPHN|nr:lysophospholipid acyltransferase family protein [Sphingomonas solaris]TVV69639.1 1-acyl-sn-glycerol-3-phosphate acyltransferase [Sphingomonas solaris]
MARLRNVLFALAFYPGSLVLVVLALVIARRGARMRAHAKRWARFHYWCARHLLGIETRVEGRLPEGPALIAAKHQSMFETFELIRVLEEPAVVLKQELTEIPLWGRVAQSYGAIPVDREGSATALRIMLRAARRVVADGRAILIFPEGTRVAPGEQPPLRPGFAGLYRVTGLPVVPLALDSGLLWPRKGLKRAGVITFRFGPPIPPGLPRDEIEALVHAAINTLETKERRLPAA